MSAIATSSSFSTVATGSTSTTERAHVGQLGRLTVPWPTVLSLAAVMAFADGFWLISLQGAVGAIERSQEPFASWWRGSLLMLPVFIFAVLGALTLAMRWFGPVLRRPRTVMAAVLLVAVAGTIAGLAAIVASSAYDYHLQSGQVQAMDTMRAVCKSGNCVSEAQQATLALHVHAVIYIMGWVLLTNLALVFWVVAMRGGRLKVSTTDRRGEGRVDGGRSVGSRWVGSRWIMSQHGLMVAVASMPGARWLARRAPASAHGRGLIVVALIAIVAMGVAAAGLGWLDASGGQPVMDMSH